MSRLHTIARHALLAFLVGTLAASMLSCAASTGLVKVADKSLEVVLATATPQGPKFTRDDGCYIYGEWWAQVLQYRKDGLGLTGQLDLLNTLYAKQRAPIPGMYEFLRAQVVLAYQLPEAFLHIERRAVRDRAMNVCRQADGRTWIIARPV